MTPIRSQWTVFFNIENALAAIAVGRDMGGDPSVISAALEHLVVPGRADVMEGAGLKVFINYMHNGISCQAVLKALKKDYPGKFVTVVIGVAGQRSPARIQGVGEACGKYADRVFFSADDPDLEDPRDIDIRLAHAAADGKAEIIIEPDRTIAVERALREAPRRLRGGPGRQGLRGYPAGKRRIRLLRIRPCHRQAYPGGAGKTEIKRRIRL